MNKPQQLPRSERLKKGAAFLGQLWANVENHCPAGWTIDPCKCQPAGKFCHARNLWITLAIEDWLANPSGDGRDIDDGPFGLGVSMTASEWDATGLQMKIQHPDPGVGLIVIGSTDQCVTGMSYIAKMMDIPEALGSTLRVLQTFPKSKVQGVIFSDPVVAAPVAEVLADVAIEANPDEDFE